MKFLIGSLAALALLGQAEAIKVNSVQQFTDEIAQALEESDKKEEEEFKKTHPEPKPQPKPIGEIMKKKNITREEEPIQMSQEAIEAYSGVIAEAAEDSQPERPVEYTETDFERTEHERAQKIRPNEA